jgi:hypothetical protein
MTIKQLRSYSLFTSLELKTKIKLDAMDRADNETVT